MAVGARSAVFAPVQDLGIIVVDEEHEASYKNGETPRYLTRDVAAVRARIEGASLVLGSATPSLETMARTADRLRLLRLPERIGARPMPPVEIVDLRVAPKVAGTGSVAWSAALDAAIVETARRGRSRRCSCSTAAGYAAFLQCPDCGEVWQCPRCTISLTVHRAPPRFAATTAATRRRCRSPAGPAPIPCSRCAASAPSSWSRCWPSATPSARVARMDLDTTSTKWSHQRILGAVERGEVDLLIGTQMIAKGLDFPNVTLVGVVDADTGLYLPDFRSAERTFQLLAQVAGRAGRGPKGGRVIVQTRHPQHHALVRAARHDAEGFLARRSWSSAARRRIRPSSHLVNLIVSGEGEAETSNRAAEVADWCHALVARHELTVTVLGPAPCPLARIKDRWRWHVLLKGAVGGAGADRALCGAAAAEGGEDAGGDRSGSGVVVVGGAAGRRGGGQAGRDGQGVIPSEARDLAGQPRTRPGKIPRYARDDIRLPSHCPAAPLRPLPRCPPPAYLPRYPISVPTYITRRGAGSSTRPNTPLSVTEPMYRRSHRLFTPTNGDSCSAPTSPCQPTRRLVTPGAPRIHHPLRRVRVVRGDRRRQRVIRVEIQPVGEPGAEPEPPEVIGHARQPLAVEPGPSGSSTKR